MYVEKKPKKKKKLKNNFIERIKVSIFSSSFSTIDIKGLPKIEKRRKKHEGGGKDHPSKHGNQLKHLKARDSCVIQRIFDRIIVRLDEKMGDSGRPLFRLPFAREKGERGRLVVVSSPSLCA